MTPSPSESPTPKSLLWLSLAGVGAVLSVGALSAIIARGLGGEPVTAAVTSVVVTCVNAWSSVKRGAK